MTVSKNKSKKNLKKIKQYYFIIEFIAVTVITFLIIFLLETFNKPKFNSNDLLPGLENSFYPIIAWLLYIVIIDLIFMRFSKRERSSFYTLGTLGLFSFLFSFISLFYMFFLKIFENKPFIDTPMPLVFIFFTLSGFIFFSLNLVLETMKKILNSGSKGIKNYKVIN